MLSRLPCFMAAGMLTIMMMGSWKGAAAAVEIIPPPKLITASEQSITLRVVRIVADDAVPKQELEVLRSALASRGISEGAEGVAVQVKLAPIDLPEFSSAYRKDIAHQAWQVTIGTEGIAIKGASAPALFYAIQALDQLIDDARRAPLASITDWPDLPLRMIMIDPARQNENFDYYKRVIRFAARYRINAILCHLTDDQTSCLHHEAYPELMHPQAWTTEQIRDLVAYAARHHITLIPEIESFGHSRMFTRREDFRDFLHQTKSDRPTMSWVGTDIAGYTNVLCPASPKAMRYLDDMYGRAARGFPHPWLHIGFDEVDISECDRCRAAFGEQTPTEWIAKMLEQCRALVEKHGKKTALWGDMILHYPDAMRDLPTTNTIIFDWHYNHDVKDDSVKLFKARGFEVVACPALVCAPHMVLPDWHNYQNIERFTAIACENDLLGVCTTIWIPARYMSDVLWPGIAFAAAHAWGGSRWDEAAFYAAFARDHWGSGEGRAFGEVANRVANVVWHRGEFVTSGWMDDAGLKSAQTMAVERRKEIEQNLAEIDDILKAINTLTPSVTRNQIDWLTFERSVRILRYLMTHVLAAPDIAANRAASKDTIAALDRECATIIGWIEEDWNRNRYAGDPNIDGLYLTNQHLLYQFKQMHKFHQELMANPSKGLQSQ